MATVFNRSHFIFNVLFKNKVQQFAEIMIVMSDNVSLCKIACFSDFKFWKLSWEILNGLKFVVRWHGFRNFKVCSMLFVTIFLVFRNFLVQNF